MTAVNILYDFLRPRPFRGKYKLAHALLPASGARTASIFGYRMELDLSDHIQKNVYAGLWETEETAQVRGILRKGMVFVDVGANVGYYTALASRLVGKMGRVLAFEPDPYSFGRLQRFVEANGIAQTRCVMAGLSNCSTTLPLFVPPSTYGNHNPSTSRYCDNMTTVQMHTLRLDDALDENEIEAVDLIKIDVEGHELRVMEGASRSLGMGRIKNILCEFNNPMLGLAGTSARFVYEFLNAKGFSCLTRDPNLDIRSQNLFFRHSSSRS